MLDIKNRNLITVDTFNEFAQQTALMDFSVEDLVAYVTSIAQVFYWLNVESVWGRLGFVWNVIDSETHRGYGHFVHTTIPFSIIPSLPDGERITQLSGNTFSQISTTDEIFVLKSDWENLVKIQNISKKMTIDLTGAPLTEMVYLRQRYDDISILSSGGDLYLKADFSQAGAEGNRAHILISSSNSSATLRLDDNNKYLNIPSHIVAAGGTISTLEENDGTIYWKGEGPLKLDYVWREIDADSDVFLCASYFYGYYFKDNTPQVVDNQGYYTIYLKSDNNEYIVYNFNKSVTTYSDRISIVGSRIQIDPNFCKGKTSKLTIDCSYNGIVSMRSFIEADRDNDVYDYTQFTKFAPIEFIGDLQEIDIYNPFIDLHDGWPELNNAVVSKIADIPNSYYICYPRYYNEITKCPYTFDLTNRDYAGFAYGNVADNVSRMSYFKESTQLTYLGQADNSHNSYGSTYQYYPKMFVFDLLPNLTGLHRFKNLKIEVDGFYGDGGGTTTIPENISGEYGPNQRAYMCAQKINSISADYLDLTRSYIYGDTNCVLSATVINNYNGRLYFEDSDKTHIYLSSDGTHSAGLFYCDNIFFKNITDINFIEIDDVENVNLFSTINTACFIPAKGYTFLQPYIIRGSNITVTGSLDYNITHYDHAGDYSTYIDAYADRYFNPSYIWIKSGTNLEFTFTINSGYESHNTYWTVANIKRLINNIVQPEGSTEVGTITLKQWIFEQFTETEKSYIMNDLGYTLIEQI